MWELNRASFRRLVQLYLLTWPLIFMAIAYEAFAPGWSAFSHRFDLLVAEHFNRVSEDVYISSGSLVIISLVWHLTATVWLLRFRAWARLQFSLSIAAMSLTLFLPGMNEPFYLGSLTNFLQGIASIPLGAILLLAYAKGYGEDWFNPALSASFAEK